MERYEVDADARLIPMLDAVARGEAVVIRRDGQVVATVEPVRTGTDAGAAFAPFSAEGLKQLEALRAMVRGAGVTDAALLVREMREADDH